MSVGRGIKALFFLAAFAAAAAAQVRNVAVVETEVDAASGASAGVTSAEARLVTTELRREAVKNLPPDLYNIMTSETVQSQGSAVLEECADENCVITLGTKIGADYIVRGIISKLRDRFTLAVEIYETEDGNLVGSATPVRAENIEELVEKVAASCAEMYEKFVKAQSSRRKRAMYAFEAGAEPAEGGSVIRNPERDEYAAGSKVSVLAAPENGYVFTGWSGAAVDTANPITITMDTVKTLTAHFAPQREIESERALTAAPPKTRQPRVSAGVGGFFANNFDGGLKWATGETLKMPYIGGGGYLYIDFKYVELLVGYSGGGGRWESPDALDQEDLAGMRRSSVSFGLFFKAPISLEKIRIFPLLGSDFELVDNVTNIRGDVPEPKLDSGGGIALWFKAGIGVDYDLSKILYARAEALYGFGFDSYAGDVSDAVGYSSWERDSYATSPCYGLTVRVAVGVRLK